MVTTVERVAGWAAELRVDEVPAPVLDLCRAQRRSVLAAVAAATADAASRRVLAGLAAIASDGCVSLVGLECPVRADTAIYAAAALSIALDFDDYMCFAHAGHSAVLVPILLAAETAASGGEQLAAQVVANEVAARLGGACLLGPLNGQLWSFVHAAGTALAAGRLFGLDRGRLAHALALALYQAPRPTVPGFMAPDSKLLTAAEPTAAGLRAARMAAAGVTGPLDALDHPQGFFAAFAYAPLPTLLGGLGVGWATRTLSVKAYPGCAYVDTTIDALLGLGPLPPDEVESVTVDAGVLTCEMDALAAPYGDAVPPTPVTVNFSIPWNVAIAVLAGQLTPTETNERWLADHYTELSRLRASVSLHHDWRLTLRTTEAMAALLPPRALLGATNGRAALGAFRQLRRDHRGLRFRPGDGLAVLQALRTSDLPGARRAARAAAVSGADRLWSPAALERFSMTFPARVRVRLRDGRELSGEADVPRGGAGNGDATPELVSREKLAACGPLAWGGAGTESIAGGIDTDADDLWARLGGGG